MGAFDDLIPQTDAQPDDQEFSGDKADGLIGEIAPGAQISSRARTPQHNAEVGGASTSMHLDDQARDVVLPKGMTPVQFRSELTKRKLPVTEFLDEKDHVHWGWGQKGGNNAFADLIPAAQVAPRPTGAFDDLVPQDQGQLMPGKLFLNPKVAPQVTSGSPRPFAPGEYIQNPNGSWSSEITVTVRDKSLNGGRATNLPSLWLVDGKPRKVSEDQAVQYAKQSGISWPSFRSIKQANDAATERENTWQSMEPKDAGQVPPLWQAPNDGHWHNTKQENDQLDAFIAESKKTQEAPPTWWETLKSAVTTTPDRWKQMTGSVMQFIADHPGIMTASPDTLGGAEQAQALAIEQHGAPEMAAEGVRMFRDAQTDIKARMPNLDDSTTKRIAYQVTAGTIDMLPVLAATAVTKSPVVGGVVMGAQGAASKYGEAKDGGRSSQQATMDSAFTGMVDGVLGSLPLGVLMKPGQTFLGKTLKSAASFGAISVMTEAMQVAYDKGLVDPAMTLKQAWDRVSEAGIVGTLQGAFLGGGHGAMESVRNRLAARAARRPIQGDVLPPDGAQAGEPPGPSGPAGTGDGGQTIEGAFTVQPEAPKPGVGPVHADVRKTLGLDRPGRPPVVPPDAPPGAAVVVADPNAKSPAVGPDGVPLSAGGRRVATEGGTRIAGRRGSSAGIETLIPGNAAHPDVVNPRAEGIPRRDIEPDTAVTSSGREVPVQYAIVEAGHLVTSQTPEGHPNPRFPGQLQPRDRTRAVSQAQVASIANNINPKLLDRSPNASDGAPIVSSSGVVESGNGRTMAIQRAYQEGLPSGDAYRRYLEERGYPVQDMKHPVLVRVRTGDMEPADRQAFVREANQSGQLGYSATERALSDAAALPDHALDLYRGGDVEAAGNREFVRAFMGHAVPATEHAGMVGKDGALSQEAIRRVRGALLAKAYADPELVSSVIESQDSNVKAIGGALTDAAADWAMMRSAANRGEIPASMDQTDKLLAAVKLVARARQDGRNVAEFVNQNDIFTGTALDRQVEAWLRMMFRNTNDWTHPAGRDKLADGIKFFAGEAQKAQAGANLLGEPPVTSDDILRVAKAKQYGQDISGEGSGLSFGQDPRAYGRAGEQPGIPGSEAPGGAQDAQGRAQSPAVKGRFGDRPSNIQLASQHAGDIQNLTDELHGFLAKAGIGPASPDVQKLGGLAEYIYRRGLFTGFEQLAVMGADHYVVARSDGRPNAVAWGEQTKSYLMRPEAEMVTVHNHPSNTGPSAGDLASLAYPGHKHLVVVTQNGDFHAARLNPKLWTTNIHTANDRAGIIKTMKGMINAPLEAKIRPLLIRGQITMDQANELHVYVTNRAMELAGLIHYMTDWQAPAGAGDLRSFIQESADDIRSYIQRNHPEHFPFLGSVKSAEYFDRHPGTVHVKAGLASIFGQPDGAAGSSGSAPSQSRSAPAPRPRAPEQLKLLEDEKRYKTQTGLPAFKKWFKGSKVVSPDGKPLVVYHGTPADFDTFSPQRGNVESDFGAGLYFTNKREDVAANYAGMGPDLTQKIELEIERRANERDVDYKDPALKAEVTSEMMAHQGATMPVFLDIKEPFLVGGPKETFLDYEQPYDDENDEYGEETGKLVDFVVALRNATERRQGDADELIGNIMEHAVDFGGIKASELDELVRKNEKFGYTEDEDGRLVSHEVYREALEDAGFDGVIDHSVNKKFGTEAGRVNPMAGMDRNTVHYIAFKPTQVKSAIGNRGTFDPTDPNILREDENRYEATRPPFYSQLTRSVEDLKLTRAPAKDWLGVIENLKGKGVKAEEISWSGIEDWLKSQTGPVTKAEVIAHLKQNEVRVQEVTRGTSEAIPQAMRDERNALMDVPWRDRTAEQQNRLTTIEDQMAKRAQPKFSTYVLPGGENYRELLLTLPRHLIKDQPDGTTTDNFRSGHWDEPNVLAHVRFDDRTGPNGEKVLHVAEIQSDWHQKGRRVGYAGDSTNMLVLRDKDGNLQRRFEMGQEAEARAMAAEYGFTLATEHAPEKATGTVPNAPFKTSWHELAAKRMLRYAAEHGYDRLSWDTGETNAERYDLSKQVHSIVYEKNPDGTYRLLAEHIGGRQQFTDLGKKIPEDKLSDYVGKDVADKIVLDHGKKVHGHPFQRELSGLDLKVGGEGMKGFYDKILPASVTKIVKKWGGKVEASQIKKGGEPDWEYRGPEPTSEQIDSVKNAVRARGQVWDSPVTGERQMFQVNRVSNLEIDRVASAMAQGESFAGAMRNYGSRSIAQLFGGEMVDTKTAMSGAKVHSVSITPAMRESVMQGQALFEDASRYKTEPGALDGRGKAVDQTIMPGAEASAQQLAKAREAQGGGKLGTKVQQKAPSGLFGDEGAPDKDQLSLFEDENRYNDIRAEDRDVMEKAARTGDWIGKFKAKGASAEARIRDAIGRAFQAWKRNPGSVPLRVRQVFSELRHAGDEVAIPGLQDMPTGRPTAMFKEKLRAAADAVMDLVHDVQMLVTPMALGTNQARATAKNFANMMRLARWHGNKMMEGLKKNFTPDQLRKMWEAADEESVLRQNEESTAGRGLATLSPEERRAVLEQQADADAVWQAAKDQGMVEGDGLPSYVPRMMVEMAGGEFTRLGSSGDTGRDIPGMGRNVRTSTPQMKHRKHMTTEETEAAGSSKFGTMAQVVRDIRTLPLATMRLREAVAGRALINKIKEIGQKTGEDTVVEGHEPAGSPYKWFTINNPAFKTWRIKLIKNEETGKHEPAVDQNGDPVFEKVPLYVRSDFEGPLRAVLTGDSSKFYLAMMDMKGRAMSAIMYSPLIHNIVEWGRALPAMPGKVFTTKIYFEGNRAKRDPEIMSEAIMAGLVPIGHQAGFQDITSIANPESIKAGRSWTAKILGLIPGLFSKNAREAVHRGVDALGDFWHNTLLWDRVGDLQMGLYINFRDQLIKKGNPRQASAAMAAHFANRYAGALPMEAMSGMARKIANLVMFSRSYTIGNLGAMKDVITGLPRDVQAEIEQAGAPLKGVRSMAARKALSILLIDIGLFYATNSILQSALAYLSGRDDLSEIERGYVDRALKLSTKIKESPLEALNIFGDLQALSATSDNEPGRENRILVGYDHNGTAIYARNPSGKIGEEFVNWFTKPLETVKAKLSTFAKPTYQVLTNDAGFGKHVYDPEAKGLSGLAKNVGDVVSLYFKAQVPTDTLDATRRIMQGKDEPIDKFKVLGPLAGVTFSKGAPGGPAVGEIYGIKREQDAKVSAAMPGIIEKIKQGDIKGARADMKALKIDPHLQVWYIKVTKNPKLRLLTRKNQATMRNATPEQRARFKAAKENSQ